MKLPSFQNVPPNFDYFERVGKSFEILAQNGWFICLAGTPLKLIDDAEYCFQSGQIKKGDKIMVEHFRQQLDTIEKTVGVEFPLRNRILRKAFHAHRRKEYELSIPVMLAQIDGIGEDIFGKDVSSTSRKAKNVNAQKQLVKTKFDKSTTIRKMLESYYSLIASTLPINASTQERKSFLRPFNRHLVLHGIDIDYATEINALKTVSWLQYIVSLK